MLQASQKWKWFVCPTSKLLKLTMGEEMVFITPYKLRQLNNGALKNPAFSLEDAAFYEQVYSYLNEFSFWSQPQLCQISLNATAIKFYLKPILAKSWFFSTYLGDEPSVEAIVHLNSKQGMGNFLIVDQSDGACLCMCLEHDFNLDENLSLKQFEVIRVLNDRIHPVLLTHTMQQRA